MKQLFKRRLTKKIKGLHAYVRGDWVGLLIPYGVDEPFSGMHIFEAEEYADKRGYTIIFLDYNEGELEYVRTVGGFKDAVEVVL